ncbi:hypothetical protein PMAYCL1PPCAC_28888 [Pristionchus mayeri]|uniref:Uncharacterized protein n=1 Tax=Pristionchus mayeri TaxID=1317129 RepID=A0AAN5IAF0_9BILA|nr:hypothetical protein PMAYCL1PPCAC_28888 [Pristionchus mayeri]
MKSVEGNGRTEEGIELWITPYGGSQRMRSTPYSATGEKEDSDQIPSRLLDVFDYSLPLRNPKTHLSHTNLRSFPLFIVSCLI